jgi:hypothetical protein
MQQKSKKSKVQMRLFDPPKVPLKSIDEHTDVDRHDTPEHDEMEHRTPHDSIDECIVDGEEAIHGETQIKSIGALDLTFLVDEACVPIKIQNIAGNF